VVQLLLEQGADVNAQGGEYGNALEAASSIGHQTTDVPDYHQPGQTIFTWKCISESLILAFLSFTAYFRDSDIEKASQIPSLSSCRALLRYR
jgi:hypothetical protein